MKACKNMGFDVLEISSGFLSIPTESWLNLIEDTKKHGLKPKPEVGIQYVYVSVPPSKLSQYVTAGGALVEMRLPPS